MFHEHEEEKAIPSKQIHNKISDSKHLDLKDEIKNP